MSPVPHSAKAAAKAGMATTGEKYTTALRHVLDTDRDSGPPAPRGARAYLTVVLAQLEKLGWSAEDVHGPESGRLETFAAP
ncbi:hypothetical protein ACFU5O_36480 [Streptomyces sp. NPDC057445]|uniref:hypothetical protein n=1 Tax=Streptomyces sp. NPDC057445 TaxID=3346136 RepID=UPI00369296A2